MRNSERQGAIKVLQGARFLLSSPQAWIKDYYMMRQLPSGLMAECELPEAICFCVLGAIEASAVFQAREGLHSTHPVRVALRSTVRDMGFPTVPKFNDHPPHQARRRAAGDRHHHQESGGRP